MGAQLRVYKQKIASAQTTKKITKAMELIAASRIQKAMARVRASSPFARAVTRAVSAVATHSNVQHPLTTEREVIRRSAVVIFASDRGLAGAFNSQILREGLQLGELLRSQGKEVEYFLVGRKAVGYFQFRRMQAAGEWIGDTDTPHFNTAEQIAGALLDAYDRGGEEEGGVDEIHLVFNRFVSMMMQEPQTVRLLRGKRADVAVLEVAELAVARRDESVAHVKSAAPISDAQSTRLAQVLGQIYGRTIAVQLDVDPELLGGLVVNIGDEEIDGSLSSRLSAAALHLPN